MKDRETKVNDYLAEVDRQAAEMVRAKLAVHPLRKAIERLAPRTPADWLLAIQTIEECAQGTDYGHNPYRVLWAVKKALSECRDWRRKGFASRVQRRLMGRPRPHPPHPLFDKYKGRPVDDLDDPFAEPEEKQ